MVESLLDSVHTRSMRSITSLCHEGLRQIRLRMLCAVAQYSVGCPITVHSCTDWESLL
jgi:hypothetical protein